MTLSQTSFRTERRSGTGERHTATGDAPRFRVRLRRPGMMATFFGCTRQPDRMSSGFGPTPDFIPDGAERRSGTGERQRLQQALPVRGSPPAPPRTTPTRFAGRGPWPAPPRNDGVVSARRSLSALPASQNLERVERIQRGFWRQSVRLDAVEGGSQGVGGFDGRRVVQGEQRQVFDQAFDRRDA